MISPLATGTGFCVEFSDKVFLITNRHNLSGRRPDTNEIVHPTLATPDAVTIAHPAAGRLGTWVTRRERLLDDNGAPLWLEHPTYGRRVDVVALELSQLEGVQIYAHDPWADGPDLLNGVSVDVSVIGFPFGLTGGGAFGIWTRGTVATEPAVDFNDLPLFLIDSRTRPGQSGSPVLIYSAGGAVALNGGNTGVFAGPVEKFVGVYSGRVNAQSDLGFVWKASVVRELLERGVRKPAE